jgi:YD repeat-containing protein
VTDRKGQVTTLTYDPLDRLTHVDYAGTLTTGYEFDAGDRLTRVTDSAADTISTVREIFRRTTREAPSAL